MNSNAEDSTRICFPPEEAGILLKAFVERDLQKQQVDVLKESLAVQEQRNKNLEDQLEIQKQLTAVEARRAEVEHTAYEREKEITDRALKLAEQTKPKQPFQLWGLIAAIGVIIGLVL